MVSQDPKVVEFFGGQQLPIPNAPKSLKIKVMPDQASNTIKVESYESPILKFQNEYKLSPTENGKGTIVKYSSVSNDISKQIGMDIPPDMRKQIGLENFHESAAHGRSLYRRQRGCIGEAQVAFSILEKWRGRYRCRAVFHLVAIRRALAERAGSLLWRIARVARRDLLDAR